MFDLKQIIQENDTGYPFQTLAILYLCSISVIRLQIHLLAFHASRHQGSGITAENNKITASLTFLTKEVGGLLRGFVPPQFRTLSVHIYSPRTYNYFNVCESYENLSNKCL